MNEIVTAGHRYFGLGYLILAEDGASPRCDDPDLPRNILRLTIATGRQIDLTGPPADEMRRILAESAPDNHVIHGRQVQSSPRRGVSPVSRGPRKAK